jgi:hypothetical protein
MWNPLPDVTEHHGATIPPDSDFFADPPADIGPVRTAHTSLRQNMQPKSAVVRLSIALACGAALEILLLALDHQTQGFLSHMLGETDPPLALVLVPIALLAACIAWITMRFSHTCHYVGEDGIARFTCKRKRANIKGGSIFLFKNAATLVTTLNDHYRNSTYTHTNFGFYWFLSPKEKAVFAIKGMHNSPTGHPTPKHTYHFYRSAESSWYRHIAARIEAELAQKGRVSFDTGHGWTALGPGFIEIMDGQGKVSRFVAAEVGSASTVNGVLQITRRGTASNPLDSSEREGVSQFKLAVGNLPIFRYLLNRCLELDTYKG